MTSLNAIIPQEDEPQAVISLVLDGLTTEHSQGAYSKALADFMAWYVALGKPGLTKAVIQRYKVVLQDSGVSSSTNNLRMSAIHKLAQDTTDNGFIDQAIANGVATVKGVKTQGVRTGNWLTGSQPVRHNQGQSKPSIRL